MIEILLNLFVWIVAIGLALFAIGIILNFALTFLMIIVAAIGAIFGGRKK